MMMWLVDYRFLETWSLQVFATDSFLINELHQSSTSVLAY